MGYASGRSRCLARKLIHATLPLPQRFIFTPLDAAKQGQTHPTVIPVGPVHGMEMLIS